MAVGVGVGVSLGLGLGDADGDALTTADGVGDGDALRLARTIAATTRPTTTTALAMTSHRCQVHRDGGSPSGPTGKPL